MKNIITGVQPTGTPHLGNILGAMKPTLDLRNNPTNNVMVFIADLHALNSFEARVNLHENTMKVAASFLALGGDSENVILFRQSKLASYHTELMYYLSCVTRFPTLTNNHLYKVNKNRLGDLNLAMFSYPVLQAADIILYGGEIVPVGSDQLQHIEITRDIINTFNHTFNLSSEDKIILPEAKVTKEMIIGGIDGQKMSKSLNNYISPFDSETSIKTRIRNIVTSSLGINDPKDPYTDNIYKIYTSIVGEDDFIKTYIRGGVGYGDAKNRLITLFLEHFYNEKVKYDYYMSNPDVINEILITFEDKMKLVAEEKLNKIKGLMNL